MRYYPQKWVRDLLRGTKACPWYNLADTHPLVSVAERQLKESTEKLEFWNQISEVLKILIQAKNRIYEISYSN